MPESGKGSLKRTLTRATVTVLASHPHLRLAKVADGARDNWSFLTDQLPPGVEVLDYFHAVEHLTRALAAAYGESSAEFQRMHKRLRHKLRDDDQGVEKVIRSLRHLAKKHPKRKALRTELAYFRRNRHRMRYAQVSGMRWRNHGGQAVLTFRALQQSGDFDLAWRLLHHDRVGTARVQQELPPAERPRLIRQVAV